MKLRDLNKHKNASCCIHGKRAFQLIIGKDESFEVIREDDPELTKKLEKPYDKHPDFYRTPSSMMYVSQDYVSICGDTKVHLNAITNTTMKEIYKNHEIVETLCKLQKMITPEPPAKPTEGNKPKRDSKGRFKKQD